MLRHYLLALAVLAAFAASANAKERKQIHSPSLTQTTASGVANSNGSAVGADVRSPRTDVPRRRMEPNGTMDKGLLPNGLLPNQSTYG